MTVLLILAAVLAANVAFVLWCFLHNRARYGKGE